MTDRSILERVFPLEDNPEPNVLAGRPDFTDGQAEDYLKALNEEDREIVHWYALQALTPSMVTHYAADLVTGYALVDPSRTAQNGMLAAHKEIARVRRFLQLFLESKDFFPRITLVSRPVYSEHGEYEGISDISGWTNIAGVKTEPEDVQERKDRIIKEGDMEYLDQADSFVDDPMGAPDVFDQAAILLARQEAMTDLLI